MTNHSRHTSPRSPLGIISRRPIVCIPPHDVDFYAGAGSGTLYSAVGAVPNLAAGVSVFGPPGLACNLNIQSRVGATFVAGMIFTIRVTGRDHMRRPRTEDVVCEGNGAADQNFPTVGMWSTVSNIEIINTTADIPAVVLTSVGIGDGHFIGAISQPGTMVLQHPIPGMSVAGNVLALLPLNAAPTASNFMVATHTVLGGLGIEFRSAAFAPNILARVASVYPLVDDELFDYAYAGVRG